VAGDADRRALRDHRVVGRFDGGSHHQIIHRAAVARRANHAIQHSTAAEAAQHLAGQAAGAHPGLDDAEGAHADSFVSVSGRVRV
jgi:hypothetical protein